MLVGRRRWRLAGLASLAALVAAGPLAGSAHSDDVVFYKRSVDDGATFENFYSLSAPDADDALRPHVAVDTGVVHVAWEQQPEPEEVLYRNSPDDGVGFGATVNVSNSAGESTESDLALDRTTLHFVWEEELDAPGEAYYRRSPDAGLTFGNSFTVSNSPDLNSRDPDIAASNDDLVGVVWEDPQPAGASTDDIFFTRSVDAGLTWSLLATNVSNDGGDSEEAAVAISDNAVHVVWEARPGRIGYNRSTDSGSSWEAPRLLPTGADRSPAVTAVGSTVHVVACQSSSAGDLLYFRSTDEGATWSGPVNLTSDARFCREPSIAGTSSSNSVYVAWRGRTSSGNNDIFFTRSHDDGMMFAPVVNLSSNAGSSQEPSVAVDDRDSHDVYVVWRDNTKPEPQAAPEPAPDSPDDD